MNWTLVRYWVHLCVCGGLLVASAGCMDEIPNSLPDPHLVDCGVIQVLPVDKGLHQAIEGGF